LLSVPLSGRAPLLVQEGCNVIKMLPVQGMTTWLVAQIGVAARGRSRKVIQELTKEKS
jgi:hypothetical protein